MSGSWDDATVQVYEGDGKAMGIVKFYAEQMGYPLSAKFEWYGPTFKPEYMYMTNEGFCLGSTIWYVRLTLNGRRQYAFGETPELAVLAAHDMIKNMEQDTSQEDSGFRMTDKASPRPWRIKESGCGVHVELIDAEGTFIGDLNTLDGATTETSIANAELIISAVNDLVRIARQLTTDWGSDDSMEEIRVITSIAKMVLWLNKHDALTGGLDLRQDSSANQQDADPAKEEFRPPEYRCQGCGHEGRYTDFELRPHDPDHKWLCPNCGKDILVMDHIQKPPGGRPTKAEYHADSASRPPANETLPRDVTDGGPVPSANGKELPPGRVVSRDGGPVILVHDDGAELLSIPPRPKRHGICNNCGQVMARCKCPHGD